MKGIGQKTYPFTPTGRGQVSQYLSLAFSYQFFLTLNSPEKYLEIVHPLFFNLYPGDSRIDTPQNGPTLLPIGPLRSVGSIELSPLDYRHTPPWRFL